MLVKKVNDIDWLKLIFSSSSILLNIKMQSQSTINSKKYNFINNNEIIKYMGWQSK
jgi:hypothetical protein